VFVELKKQYELAKLEEIKNITIVNVLDPGRVPVKKERPKRGLNTGVAFFVTILGMIGYYSMASFYLEKFQRTFNVFRKEDLPG
jgi:uncharacterized protein involved in exopolysaccharide biosynthesis